MRERAGRDQHGLALDDDAEQHSGVAELGDDRFHGIVCELRCRARRPLPRHERDAGIDQREPTVTYIALVSCASFKNERCTSGQVDPEWFADTLGKHLRSLENFIQTHHFASLPGSVGTHAAEPRDAMQTRLLLLASASMLALACAGSDGTDGGPGTTPADNNPTTTTDPNAPLDPVDDPIPAGLPVLAAYDKVTGAEVAADVSCFSKPLEVAHGTAADREFHLIELGGQDGDRVGDAKVDLFLDNEVSPAPDATIMVKKTEDKLGTGVFSQSTRPGWIAYRVAPAAGYVPIIGLDLEVPESGPVQPAVPTEDKVKALSMLIGGSTYTATRGAGRAVIRIMDCNYRTLSNTHVVLEIDGKVRRPSKSDGLRRSYFSDSEFPSAANWTSHSGVVAFLEIPAGATSIRAVARANVDGQLKVVAIRKIPLVADGIAAAKVFPYTTP